MNNLKLCHLCGAPTTITRSWTPINLGRHFFMCPNCGFDDWMDPPMCPRSVAIIPVLLRRINNIEETYRLNARKARRVMMLLCLSWVLFCFVCCHYGFTNVGHVCKSRLVSCVFVGHRLSFGNVLLARLK